MRQNGNITVYGRKKNWEGGNYEDGIQQKTEKSYLLDSMSEEVRRQISACQQMETIQEDE